MTPADTIRSIIFTGRPLRIRKVSSFSALILRGRESSRMFDFYVKNAFVLDWENNRQAEIKELTGRGILPVGMDTEERPHLMGSVSAMVKVRHSTLKSFWSSSDGYLRLSRLSSRRRRLSRTWSRRPPSSSATVRPTSTPRRSCKRVLPFDTTLCNPVKGFVPNSRVWSSRDFTPRLSRCQSRSVLAHHQQTPASF